MSMPSFLLAKLKQAQPSMRRRLFLYMGALAALLLFSLFAVLLLLGQLKSPREEMKKSLTFQMEAFRSDVTSLWRNVSVMGVHLSEDMTALIEERVKDFDALSGSADALEQLEASMLGPLCQYVQQADCSGGFVLLSVSLTPDAAADSFSGLYVQRSNAEHTTSDLLLYRGMADIGRQHRVMPHRKWAQEFCPADFPGLADQLEAASAPIERLPHHRASDPARHHGAGDIAERPHGRRGRQSVWFVRFFRQPDLLLGAPCAALRCQQPCLCSVGFCGGAGCSKRASDLSHRRLLFCAG